LSSRQNNRVYSTRNELEELRQYAEDHANALARLNATPIFLCGTDRVAKNALSSILLQQGFPLQLFTHSQPATSTDPTESATERSAGISRGVSVTTFSLASGTTFQVVDFATEQDFALDNGLWAQPHDAVFLVLFSLTQSDQNRENDVTTWLQGIRSRCPRGSRPHVVLVGAVNKPTSYADQPALDLATAQERYHATLSSMHKSSWTESMHFLADKDASPSLFLLLPDNSTDLGSLTELLESHHRTKPGAASPLPPDDMARVYMALHGYRSQMAFTKVLAVERFNSFIQSAGVPNDKVASVVDELHALGEIYVAKEDGPLVGCVVIDTVWLYRDVLGWITCKYPPTQDVTQLEAWAEFHEHAAQDPVPKDALPLQLLGDDIEGDMILFILEHFNMCFPVPVGKSKEAADVAYIFPSLLAQPLLHEEWSATRDFTRHVGLQVTFEDTPPAPLSSIFNCFQVRLVRLLNKQRDKNSSDPTPFIDTVRAWRHAVLYSQGKAQALARFYPECHRLRVHVRYHSTQIPAMFDLLQIFCIVLHLSVRDDDSTIKPAVAYCSVKDLSKYCNSPHMAPIKEVYKAREQQYHFVRFGPNHVEDVRSVCGLAGIGAVKM
jgi:hypothetical protein